MAAPRAARCRAAAGGARRCQGEVIGAPPDTPDRLAQLPCANRQRRRTPRRTLKAVPMLRAERGALGPPHAATRLAMSVWAALVGGEAHRRTAWSPGVLQGDMRGCGAMGGESNDSYYLLDQLGAAVKDLGAVQSPLVYAQSTCAGNSCRQLAPFGAACRLNAACRLHDADSRHQDVAYSPLHPST